MINIIKTFLIPFSHLHMSFDIRLLLCLSLRMPVSRKLTDDAKIAASHQNIFKMGEVLGNAVYLHLQAICSSSDKML